MKISAQFLRWTVLSLPLLTGCSDNAPNVEPQPHKAVQEFSEEEKRAARALSISNTEVLAETESPYSQTLLCRHGIAEVRSLIGETAGLSSEQEEALSQAEALYDQRLRDLAGAAGKSPNDIPQDLERTAEENPNRATNVRVAMACVRELQQG